MSTVRLMDSKSLRPPNIQDALLLVQSLRHGLVDRNVSRGFSGPARAISGVIALMTACGLAIWAPAGTPFQTHIHLFAWALVLLIASIINAGALLHFFLNDPQVNRDPRRLRPVLHAVPPLAVGAVLTLAFVLQRNPDPLFGIWMCMFGLVNFASRDTLPSIISYAGIFYILAGSACLVAPGFQFTNPWPMGIAFFAGEVASGMILIVDRRRLKSVQALLRNNSKPNQGTEPGGMA